MALTSQYIKTATVISKLKTHTAEKPSGFKNYKDCSKVESLFG